MSEYFTVAQLKKRGWTNLLIVKYLGEPDELRQNPHRKGTSHPMKLYRRSRVINAQEWAMVRGDMPRDLSQ
jgi:hypothetical protein